MRRLTFILNPLSGGRRRRDRGRSLAGELAARCPGAEVLVTERPGQARAWAHARRDDPDRGVVAVGGDGTVHEVGSGLVGGRAALGVLAAGSGNDFAKMLDVPEGLDDAIRHFGSTAGRSCDAGEVRLEAAGGRVSYHHFMNGLGVGYEAVVADAAARARFLRGGIRYPAAALWHLVTYRAPSMKVSLNGELVTGPIFLLAIGNGRCAGGRFYLTPEADIGDGLLDICYTQATSLVRILRILPTTFRGRHGRFPEVRTTRTDALDLDCPQGCMVHADGELLSRRATRLRVRVLPGALTVLG